jgi:hypothetical protein
MKPEKSSEMAPSLAVQEAREIVRKLRGDQAALREAISESLSYCGEPVTKTILWHLKARGIFLDSNEEIDLALFYKQLEDLFGSSAGLILDGIIDSLMRTR